MKLFQAEFDASELITQRELVSQRINQFLGQRCATFGLILDDISIVSKAYRCFMTNRRVFFEKYSKMSRYAKFRS